MYLVESGYIVKCNIKYKGIKISCVQNFQPELICRHAYFIDI